MAERPVIGISSSVQQARWGPWDLPAIVLPRRYADMVARAAGLPVLLPPADGAAGLLDRLDGVVLSGGGDLDPALYGAAREPECGPVSLDRDRAELDLCRGALASGLPLLGICRGLQVINVALGGTLHQHLPGVVGHEGHSPEPSGYGSHDVTVTAGSLLAAVLGQTKLAVPTHHHQAIDKLGAGLVASARAADGIVEAAELGPPDGLPRSGVAARHPFVLAVQWHPEVGDDARLFKSLVTAAARRIRLGCCHDADTTGAPGCRRRQGSHEGRPAQGGRASRRPRHDTALDRR